MVRQVEYDSGSAGSGQLSLLGSNSSFGVFILARVTFSAVGQHESWSGRWVIPGNGTIIGQLTQAPASTSSLVAMFGYRLTAP